MFASKAPSQRSSSPESLSPPTPVYELRNVRLCDILFYQDYIANHFIDGRGLMETIGQLQSGAASPESLPTIECLGYQGKYYGMGNRRLACFHFVYRNSPERTIPVLFKDVSDEPLFLRQGSGVEVSVGGGLFMPCGRVLFSMKTCGTSS